MRTFSIMNDIPPFQSGKPQNQTLDAYVKGIISLVIADVHFNQLGIAEGRVGEENWIVSVSSLYGKVPPVISAQEIFYYE